jgi:hypothetical protein
MVIRYILLFILIFLSGCGTQIYQTTNTTNVTVANESIVSFGDSANIDAFGRLRVSQITSSLDIKLLQDKKPLFIDEIINGSATSIHDSSSVIMTTSEDGDYVIRQTYQRAYYQNGKSQLIFMTFDNFAPQTNIIKRIGYYSSSTSAPYNTNFDGLFLESSNGEISINIYRNGTLIEKTTQQNFNINKLDGSGDNPILIDWNKSHILSIDYEWLGVGRVRWALNVGGVALPFHESNHANVYEGVYMLSPNQPFRWEIRQVGIGSGRFVHICSTAGTEGSLNRLGIERTINTASSPMSAPNSGVKYALLGLRLNENYKNEIIDILKNNILSVSNDNYYWEIHMNPKYSTTPTWVKMNDSSIEYFIKDGTITEDGVIISSGYGIAAVVNQNIQDNALRLGYSINGTADELVLVVAPLTNNMLIHGSIIFRELQ